MAAPRFLDRLPAERRAVVEPELRRRIEARETTNELHRYALGEGLDVSRATLANFAREVLGAAAEEAARVARRAAAAEAPDGDRPAAAAPPSEIAPPPAPAAEPDGLEDADPAARRRHLIGRIRAARALAERSADDPRAALAAQKLEADLMALLQEQEKRGAEVGARPRVIAYVPVRRTLAELQADE